MKKRRWSPFSKKAKKAEARGGGGCETLMRKKRVFRKQPEKGYIFEWVGKDSFCGGSIPTVFNQRWIFLKRDQMKQERDDVEYECEHIWWPTAFARNERASWSPHHVGISFASIPMSVSAVKGFFAEAEHKKKARK